MHGVVFDVLVGAGWPDEQDGTASLDVTLETASHYKLTVNAARRIMHEVGMAVAGWRDEAMAIGIPKNAIERMASWAR